MNYKRVILHFITILFVLGFVSGCSNTSNAVFKDLPEIADPYFIGEKVSERYIAESFRNFGRIDSPPSEIIYPEVCTWLGALNFAECSADQDLLQRLEERFFPLLGAQKHLVPEAADHVDHTIFGAVPLQLYLQTGNLCFYYMGIDFADCQWELPQNFEISESSRKYVDLGLSWQTRFWIDDMFMISAIQTRAFLASGKGKYINRAAYQMSVYIDSLQQPEGLFFHAPKAPFFWCRGNGWMAVAMTDLLKALPRSNIHYPNIYAAYLKMMNSLKDTRNEEGLWNQLIDDRNAWTETSGSAMFTYALISGIKEGWLDKDIYEPVARKAWISLVSYINENGDLKDVCEGTDTGNSKQYYLDRKRIIGDLNGQAPILWCATALIE